MRVPSADSPATRSGFVALAGRPNVGKSTLANAIVGAKVAIVSDKPQTTRRALRGVANGPGWQLVLVDLPGVQRPRDALTERMQHRVERELSDADACLLVVNAEQGIGPGDRFISDLLRGKAVLRSRSRWRSTRSTERPGRGSPPPCRERRTWASQRTSSRSRPAPGAGFRRWSSTWSACSRRAVLLPRYPAHGPVRAGAPGRARARADPCAHARGGSARGRGGGPGDLAPTPRPGADRGRGALETESQKGILIGAGGRMIKSIGVAARRAIERDLGTHVHLELSVQVRRHWRADERVLDRLGIE